MNPLLEIDPKSIQNLTEEPFVDVLNRLLRAEASRVGLPPTQVYTSLRTKEPDGGVDASVQDCTVASEWLPPGRSVWQFKSGDIGPSEIEKEWNAPVVQESTKNGAHYILCIGDDLTPRKKRAREDAIHKCFKNAGLTPKYRLLSTHEIAQWASQHAALCYLPQFSRPLDGDFMLWKAWADLPRFRQEFQIDPQRSGICIAIQEWLQSTSDVAHQRIEGLAGIGKTRLALEVFRPRHLNDGLHERVMYAPSITDVPKGLFRWIAASPKVSLILVVDECSRLDMDRLEQQAQQCNGRLKLLTVGQSQEIRAANVSRPDTFLLERLDSDVMRLLLEKAYPILPSEAVYFIVDKSSGFVKLAVALAAAMVRQPARSSARELLQTQQVHDVISTYLVPEQSDKHALQSVALLNRVGWDDEVELEGQAVVEFLQLNWQDTKMRVGRFVREGFVAKQGRFRYVTPHLLAVWLATEVWEALGMETVGLLDRLPTPTSRRALLERLHDLGDDPKARQVTATLLGSEQAVPNLHFINDQEHASIFALLAEINPQAGLRALQRLIEHLPRSELLTFDTGRRQIIFLLEKLAWLPDTFFGAARLLMKLADAENETWGNNASGVWVGLFGTHLGGTAVPALSRHILIQEALDSSSEKLQLLAIKAISRIFSLDETRASSAQDQGGRFVAGWRPSTWEEDRAVRLSGLALLDRVMAQDNPAVREEATKILFGRAREMVRVGLADAVIERLRQQPLTDSPARFEMRKALDDLLEFEGDALLPEQKQLLNEFREQVVGTSFADRLRRWTGRTTIADYKRSKEPGAKSPEQEGADLADEAFAAPELLRPELTYLATEATIPYPFGYRLGQLDAEHVWWKQIEPFVHIGQGYALASAYLIGNADAGRREWRDAVLDTWVAEESRELAAGVFDAVWRRMEPDDADLERLIALMEHGMLEAGRMGMFIMGGMTRHFSCSIFQRMVDQVLRDESEAATGSAIALLAQRLDYHTEDEKSLAPLAWRSLERRDVLSADTMTQHYAEELAKRYQAHDPIRIVRAVLNHIEVHNQTLLASDEPIRLLDQATRLQPKEVWEEVSSWLLSKKPNRLQLYLALQGWYAQVVGTEVMLAWVEEHQEDGPPLVAQFCGVFGNPLDTLPRELLMRFGASTKVTSQLYAQFQSGSFIGPTSQWYQIKLNAAQEWLNDPHPAVRTWAQPLVESLERHVAEWKQVEEESPF